MRAYPAVAARGGTVPVANGRSLFGFEGGTHAEDGVRRDEGDALEAADARSRAIRRFGGVASMIVASALLIGLGALAFGLPGLDLRPWLVVFFQINAGVGELPAEPLRVLNPIDVLVLVLTGVTMLGLWSLLPRRGRIWRAIVVGLPFAGIATLLATHIAGRSSLMGSGLLISLLMIGSRDLRRLGLLGAVANALLLAGDVGTGDSTAIAIAVIVGVGYVLLLTWFALVGARLLGAAR
jgi:hypothetical protein